VPTKPSRSEDEHGLDELRQQFESSLSGLDATEAGALARLLMSPLSARRLGAAPSPPRPHLRCPRREDEVTYRVRIDLVGAKPPIWRRLELSSAIFLDEFHQIIQASIGWTDSHLHRFALGDSVWDKSAEVFLTPYDVEQSEDEGAPEAEVRLDEVLVEVGDQLRYVYDFGDDWEHIVRLEAVLDRRADASRVVCTGGRRAGPPEDCGGAWGYAELVATGSVDADAFEIGQVNSTLKIRATFAETVTGASGPAAALLQRIMGYPIAYEVAGLIRDAHLEEPVQITAEEATRMVWRYAWLLDRVGDGGIQLTSAGYLPPAVVQVAVSELGIADEWIGKGNREIQTLPVLELRESAQKLGLLRKYRGRLLLTRQGQKLRLDPLGLWWHIVARLPLHDDDSMEWPAGVISLLGVAAGRDTAADDFRLLINGVLHSLGWRMATGAPLGDWSGIGAARDTTRLLQRMGGFAPNSRPWTRDEPTPGGIFLARAALHRA